MDQWQADIEKQKANASGASARCAEKCEIRSGGVRRTPGHFRRGTGDTVAGGRGPRGAWRCAWRLERATEPDLIIRTRSWAPLEIYLGPTLYLIGGAFARVVCGEESSVEEMLVASAVQRSSLPALSGSGVGGRSASTRQRSAWSIASARSSEFVGAKSISHASRVWSRGRSE